MSGAILIPLSQGRFSQIDAEDAERVCRHKWCLATGSHGRQVSATASINGMRVYLHRFIMNAQPHELYDHIDRDRLNNSKSNLRLCNKSQNGANRFNKLGRSGFRGVMITRRQEYRARVEHHEKEYLGPIRKTATDAAKDYDILARRFFGDFATLNFPQLSGGPSLGGSDQPAASSLGAQ